MEIVFLGIIVLITILILFICKKRNAWDVLAFNSVLGIVALFIIGLLADDNEVWLRIVSFMGLVATGSAFATIFVKKN